MNVVCDCAEDSHARSGGYLEREEESCARVGEEGVGVGEEEVSNGLRGERSPILID